MDFKDLLLTPFFIIIIYLIAYRLRRNSTNKVTKKYYIPALSVKLIEAISVGFIYQFYYGNIGNTSQGSGDTFLYFDHARILFDSFIESPGIWLKFMFSNGEFDPVLFKYSSKLLWYHSPTEFIIVKIASIFSVLSLHTYSSIAVCFAFLSFTGIWKMYLTFLKLYPNLHKQFAIAVLFLPSVFFWGSGLLKDSLAIGALGWVFFSFYKIFIEKKQIVSTTIILVISMYALATIKVYILLSFLPPALFWIINENKQRIKNTTIRILMTPIALLMGTVIALFSATNLTEKDSKYDLEKLGEQSKINTEYLSKQIYTGSAYDIGVFDGSFQSLLTVGPQAVIVALYRPFLWEVRNPVMLLSALEAFVFIFLTLHFIFKVGLFKSIRFITTKPILTFCLVFSIILAFGIGINSGNFGTLVRYKIPLMPFYLAALFIMQSYLKKQSKTF